MTQLFEGNPTALPDEEYFYLRSVGFPSFEEFSKNPDKWRISKDHLFQSIEHSTLIDRHKLKEQKYFWRYSKESFTLDKLSAVCKEEGYDLDQVDMLPFRTKLHGTSEDGKELILIRVFPKHELIAMGAKVPNAF